MRTIQHPGPAMPQRIDAVPVSLRRHDLLLQPGRPLLDAVVNALRAVDGGRSHPVTTSAVLRLSGGAFEPFAYVMPALSTSADHAVYFSGRFDADGTVRLHTACVTFGGQSGEPWLHCHALWTAADGSPGGGHVLPRDAVVSAPIEATAWCMDGGGFDVVRDDETRFSLFRPQPAATADAGTPDRRGHQTAQPKALVLRLAPNEDVCTAIESACRQHGLRHAIVRGGVGSTVGAVFDDGRRVEPFVTEVLIREGRVRSGADGEPVAEIDVSLVDYTGGLAEGRLARGANAVLVTFELVLEAASAAAASV